MAVLVSKPAGFVSVCPIPHFRSYTYVGAYMHHMPNSCFPAGITATSYIRDPKVSQPDSVLYVMVTATVWRVCRTCFHRAVRSCYHFTNIQAFLNCFFYVGAVNETVGYGNRVASFLYKASSIQAENVAEEFALKNEASGDGSMKRRRVLSPASESIVAQFSNVSVKNPANLILVEGLSMQVILNNTMPFKTLSHYMKAIATILLSPTRLVWQICRGQGCLVSGPSGCGKSSLLRVIGRLWPTPCGSVRIPEHVGPDGVFFLPQRNPAHPFHSSFYSYS
jgi:ABC-type uncharacterized transport system fused permease/ATPase subunit